MVVSESVDVSTNLVSLILKKYQGKVDTFLLPFRDGLKYYLSKTMISLV